MSLLLDAPLDSLTELALHQLEVMPFVRAGCCSLMGTTACIDCSLSRAIPRPMVTACDPPDACPDCTERERCPCGSETHRLALLGRVR